MSPIDTEEVLAFILVAIALMGSPGPATLGLAATGAAYDIRAGWRFMAGIMLGVMIVIVGVAAGIFAAIVAIPFAGETLSVIAIGYLCFLAYKIATAPPVGRAATPDRGPGFMTGFILNLSNPKAYAAFAALFSGFQVMPSSPVQSTYAQILICFALLCIINPAWLFAGAALRTVLRNEKTSRLVNFGFAILLVLSVLMVLFL